MTKHNGAERNTKTILDELFKRKKVATMQELKEQTGTGVNMTIYRALKKLSYRTSYSHNGRFYALNRVVHFDQHGLWSANGVWFSQHGTLLATLHRFVSESERGFFADELESILHVGVKESLLRLVRRQSIYRQRLSHSYLYCSKSSSVRKRQLANRQAKLCEAGINVFFEPERVSNEVKAAIILFTALLDERQRRLFAAVETLQFGRNAEQWIAHLLGIHPQTVSKGRRELLQGDVNFDRIRNKGAGRPRLEKKTPRYSRKSKR